MVLDAKERILSVPPVINSKFSRIKATTTNILIEATNIDVVKANIVLDTMIAMFSEYCEEPFTCEPVDVIYEQNGEISPIRIETTPLLSQRTCDAKVKDINGTIGINVSVEDMLKYCDKMMLGPAIHIPETDSIRVQVPCTRSDVLHAVDVIEDIAIAYGYNNIVTSVPPTLTVGAPLPINQFTDLLRAEIARGGYVEMLSHGLCSTAENFTNLRRPITNEAVSLANPANVEYEVVRTTLIPGALKTLAHNRSISHKDGVKLYEISDVVVRDENSDTGCRNERHIVSLYAAHTAGFEHIHGLVDRIMLCVQIQAEKTYANTSLTSDEISDRKRVARPNISYRVQHGNDPIYFDGMSAEIILQTIDNDTNKMSEKKIGILCT